MIAKGRRWTILLGATGVLAAASACRRQPVAGEGGVPGEQDAFLVRWTAIDRDETGLVWRCVFNNDVDIAQVDNASQVRRLIETAYAGQKKTFADHLLGACVPKVAAARQALAAMAGPPPALAGSFRAYATSLAKLERALGLYAERMKTRAPIKELDDLMVEHARTWYADTKPTPRAIAYHRFLACAVPGLEELADGQALYQRLADSCFKANPLPFMERVRRECGPLLQNVDAKASLPKSYASVRSRLSDREARQVQSWERCSDIARAQQRMQDAEELLSAVTEYLAARPTANVRDAR